MSNVKPKTVGDVLTKEFIQPLGITIYRLAKHIKIDYAALHRIIGGKARLSIRMAVLLSAALDTTVEFWVNIQMHQDIWLIKKNRKFKVPLKIGK